MEEQEKELKVFDLAERTAKVNFLTVQTVQNIIEIGRTMLEVKENIPFGEFQNWLENHVHYSTSTAYNFMKVAKEFPDFQSVGNLGMRKLLALTGIESEDREKIIADNDLETMTVKEVEKVIEEEKQIKKVNDFMNKLSQEIPTISLDYSCIDFNITKEKNSLNDEEIEQLKKELNHLFTEYINIYRLIWYDKLNELREVIHNERNFAHAITTLNII